MQQSTADGICVLIIDHQPGWANHLTERIHELDTRVPVFTASTLGDLRAVLSLVAAQVGVVVLDIMVRDDANGYYSTVPLIRELRERGVRGVILAATCAHNQLLLEAGATHGVDGFEGFDALPQRIVDTVHKV